MGWKTIALGAIWTAVVISWIALVGIYFIGVETSDWVMAVTGVAVVTEIGFWLTAAILGKSLWDSRKRVGEFMLRPFRRG